MRKLYILVSILAFPLMFSCSRNERIEDNSRLYFEGKLVDTEGQPVSNLLAESKTNETDLGAVLTDELGIFQFNSLNVNKSSLQLTINDSRYNTSFDPDFGFVRLSNIGSPDQRSFDFDEVTIARRANFRLVTVPQTGTRDTLTYQISYSSPNCIRYINPPSEDSPGRGEDDCFSIRERFDTKGPEEFTDSLTVDTGLNSDIILTYRINSGAENEVTIPVSTKLTRYELSY